MTQKQDSAEFSTGIKAFAEKRGFGSTAAICKFRSDAADPLWANVSKRAFQVKRVALITRCHTAG